jgi:hypothetical protein
MNATQPDGRAKRRLARVGPPDAGELWAELRPRTPPPHGAERGISYKRLRTLEGGIGLLAPVGDELGSRRRAQRQ